MKSAYLTLACSLALAAPASIGARELSCGRFDFPNCSAPDHQFARSFKGREAYGGFGGGECKATRTPVVFVHGNADRATNWDAEVSGAVAGYPKVERSVYDELRARGWRDCELYGISYLSAAERKAPQNNYHRPESYRVILAFINAVKRNTGAPQVDIVAHSLGVSMTLAALRWSDERSRRGEKAWAGVRRFVNIAGGLAGLQACRQVGPANPLAPTCGAQNLLDAAVFGFYPDAGIGLGRNAWTAAEGPASLRRMPAAHPGVAFYTLHAGAHDQVHCPAGASASCAEGALFAPAPNVRAQLDLGAGATAGRLDFDFQDLSAYARRGGDLDGVGHFKVKHNAGAVIAEMLGSECRGLACKGRYAGGPVQAAPR